MDADEALAKRVSKHGKNKSNPSTSAEVTKPSPSSQVGSVRALCESEWETVARNTEEALKKRDKRISELERELSLFKVRRLFDLWWPEGREDENSFPSSVTVFQLTNDFIVL